MKSRSERISVARIAELLQRSRLLTGDEVEALQLRWHGESAVAEDLAAFTRWLVANRYATEFQVALLLHDKFDQFFLGPYKLLERIGRGRMATIYRAVHRLGQPVALKVLPPSRARDSHALARFQQEAELAQQLRHSHVVRAFDCGEERGLYYLVMEYIEGETLQQLLDQRGRLSPDLAAEIIRQALMGLDYLHQQGFVHRNLEPANLILQRTGDEALPRLTVKILDMSLVRATAGKLAGLPTPGNGDEALAFMAPQYRAPEMIDGPDSADIRADIYTLGCVLYVALTGRPPFDDPPPMDQVIRQGSEMPEAIERIVGWMLAKDPALRYSTPIQAAEALQAFLVRSTEIPPCGDAVVLSSSVDVILTSPVLPEQALEEVSVEQVFAPRASDSFWPGQEIGGPPQEWSGGKFQAGHVRGMDSRDFRMVLVGGIGLLIAELLGWFITMLMALL